jgi:hypothetical protein
MVVEVLCGVDSTYLLLASPYIFGEGGILSYGKHLLKGQILGREVGYYNLVRLVG